LLALIPKKWFFKFMTTLVHIAKFAQGASPAPAAMINAAAAAAA
jgi:hypothetical protein